MGRTVIATAATQLAIKQIASIAGWCMPYSGSVEILAINAFFIAMFVASALLFRQATRMQVERRVAPPTGARTRATRTSSSRSRSRATSSNSCSDGQDAWNEFRK